MITIDKLISAVRAGTMTPQAAAAEAHPYGLEYFQATDADDANALSLIRQAAKAAKSPVAPNAPVAPLDSADVRLITCKRCHAHGHAGEYPFSTLASSGFCDDCV